MTSSKPQTRFAFYTALTQCGGAPSSPDSPDGGRPVVFPPLPAVEELGVGENGASAAAGGELGDREARGGKDAVEMLRSPSAAEGAGASESAASSFAASGGSVGGAAEAGAGAGAGGSRPPSSPEETPVHRNPPTAPAAVEVAAPSGPPSLARDAPPVTNGAHHAPAPRHARQPPRPGGFGSEGASSAVAEASSSSGDGGGGSGSALSNPFEEALEDALRSLRWRRAERRRRRKDGADDARSGGAPEEDGAAASAIAAAAASAVAAASAAAAAEEEEEEEEERGLSGTVGAAAAAPSEEDPQGVAFCVTIDDAAASSSDGGADLLAAKQEEWALRRERMAAYAARLSELKDGTRVVGRDQQDRVSCGRGDDDGTSAPAASPRSTDRPPRPEDLPAAPTVAPASAGDNILLSPAADVRGAARRSADEGGRPMFRPPHTPGTARILAGRPGLELAGPVRSAGGGGGGVGDAAAAASPRTPAGVGEGAAAEGGAERDSDGAGRDDAAAAAVAVRPQAPSMLRRSPTPVGGGEGVSSGDTDRDAAQGREERPPDAEERHRQRMRRRRYEEEVERGVEAVLAAILDRAAAASPGSGGLGGGGLSSLSSSSSLGDVVEAALASVLGAAAGGGSDDDERSLGTLSTAASGGARHRPSRPSWRASHERDDLDDDTDAGTPQGSRSLEGSRSFEVSLSAEETEDMEADDRYGGVVAKGTSSSTEERLLADTSSGHDGGGGRGVEDGDGSLRSASLAEELLAAEPLPGPNDEDSSAALAAPPPPPAISGSREESSSSAGCAVDAVSPTPLVANKKPQRPLPSHGPPGVPAVAAPAVRPRAAPSLVPYTSSAEDGMVGVEAIQLMDSSRHSSSCGGEEEGGGGGGGGKDDDVRRLATVTSEGAVTNDEEEEGEEDDDVASSAVTEDVEIDVASLVNNLSAPSEAMRVGVDSGRRAGVLGPLSKKMGGTTGIVLTSDTNDEAEEEEEDDGGGGGGGYGGGAGGAAGGSTAASAGGRPDDAAVQRRWQQQREQQREELRELTPPPPPPAPHQPVSPSLLQSLSDTFLRTVGTVSPFADQVVIGSGGDREPNAPKGVGLRSPPDRPAPDRYSMEEELVEEEEETEKNSATLGSKDEDAAALVRVLCAHLLPYGVDREGRDDGGGGRGRRRSRAGGGTAAATSPSSASASRSPRSGGGRRKRASSDAANSLKEAVGNWFGVASGSEDTEEYDDVVASTGSGDGGGHDRAGAGRAGGGRPHWNESDPDEPGYVAHRLTRSELRRVEAEFERVVTRFRAASERELMGGEDRDRDRRRRRGRLPDEDGGEETGGRTTMAGEEKALEVLSSRDDFVTEETEEEPSFDEDDGEGEEVVNVNSSDDSGFERDLEEAERLLEEEEKTREAEEESERAAAAKAATAGVARERERAAEAMKKVFGNIEGVDDEEDDGDGMDESKDEDLDIVEDDDGGSSEDSTSVGSSGFEDEDEDVMRDHKNQDLLEAATGSTSMASSHQLAANPDFPMAYPTGRGRLGDLELFHLPIIYKSHQTGFEPTKDLVLTSGSIFAGQYLVQNELGSAAFSTAYRCIDLQSGKVDEDGEEYHEEVCLKVIKNTKDFFDQSLDEIKVLELLRQTGRCHENNIVEMRTFFYHREHLVIVTELLRQNLYEFGKFIAENDEPPYFTRRRLCYITRQVLVALGFIHRRGLVHSDVKPENILLSSYSRARVKLIDFGSSCYLTDRQSSYIQSRSYRAPEVILGLPYDGKIDVWSLGCVIAEMYTGEVTFQNDSVVTMLSRIEAVCGAFPRHLIASGRQSGQFFTGSGLLYERAGAGEGEDSVGGGRHSDLDLEDDDEHGGGDDALFHVYTPKVTTLAARLGLEADLMERMRRTDEEEEKAMFVDFVRSLLTIDPDSRPTADEALRHPWILSFGVSPSERDIKYPPE